MARYTIDDYGFVVSYAAERGQDTSKAEVQCEVCKLMVRRSHLIRHMAKFHPGAPLPSKVQRGNENNLQPTNVASPPTQPIKRDTCLDIRGKLIAGAYKTTAHVQLSVVARILFGLGWDIWNPSEVSPMVHSESSQSTANLTLFVGSQKPSVVIEARSPDAMTDLAEAIRGPNTPFFVVTDGQKWHFFCSTTDLDLPLQRFKIADMVKDPIDDVISAFRTFLARPAIQSGNARRNALDVLRSTHRLKVIKRWLPDAQKLALRPPYPTLPEALVQCLKANGHTIAVEEVVPLIELVSLPLSSQPPGRLADIPLEESQQELPGDQHKQMFSGQNVAQQAVGYSPASTRAYRPTTSRTLPPDGTLCRFQYKSGLFRGEIKGHRLVIVGHGEFETFSGASTHLTGTNRNGWRDWECQLPETKKWMLADDWRKKR